MNFLSELPGSPVGIFQSTLLNGSRLILSLTVDWHKKR